MFTIMAGNTSEKCEREAFDETCARLSILGPLSIHDGEKFILVDGARPPQSRASTLPAPAVTPEPELAKQGYLGPMSPAVARAVASVQAVQAAPVYSDFGQGNQVIDHGAKARIEAQHEALKLRGIAVDVSEQLYATGTRMAEVGYQYQTDRKREHDKSEPVHSAALALRDSVLSEKRQDITIEARELAKSVMVNSKITCLGGYQVTEQAIRGMAVRLDSPMLGYILGLRNRIAAELSKGEQANREQAREDRRTMANVIAHELDRMGDLKLKLRVRDGVGDVFACVSPGYAPADAPEVLDRILDKLPQDAKGSWSYDPTSTAWELRAEVWTPTPVEAQAVGEAFSGYVSFQSRDNGSSSFRGGGGVLLLRCLNASTYTAQSSNVRRRHMGEIMVDIGTMLEDATQAIHALCEAWGTNRETVITAPPVPLGVAIPGFWSYLLRDRASELSGVLPGRTVDHVKGLTQAFFDERRDSSKLVRSDFAQGWTRYIQDQATPVRRDAEQAIGDWLMSQSRLVCDLPKEVRA